MRNRVAILLFVVAVPLLGFPALGGYCGQLVITQQARRF